MELFVICCKLLLNKTLAKLKVLIWIFLIFNMFSVYADEYIIHGPITFEREKGRPEVDSTMFEFFGKSQEGVIRIYNGGINNSGKKLKTLRLEFNGETIERKLDKKQHITELPVLLKKSNEINIKLQSGQGSLLTVVVVGNDNDQPSIISKITPQANQHGWQNQPVKIDFTCDVKEGEIKFCSDSVILSDDGSNQVVTGTVKDKSGNENTVDVVVSIDQKKPNLEVNYSIEPNESGWFLEPVTVSYSASDSLSGVDVVPDSQIINVASESFPINTQVSDLAGNITSYSNVINIDLLPPNISILSPESNTIIRELSASVLLRYSDDVAISQENVNYFVNNQSVTPNCTALDGQSLSCLIDSGLVAGDNQIIITATDKAGRSSETQLILTAVLTLDRDGDSVNDDEDVFPDDPTEWADLDGDGIGDNSDTDRDGDGVINDVDAFPNDATETSDLDGDGIGDNADTDRDGDGVNNDLDAFPNHATETSDLDGDGIGDNSDPDRDGDGVNNNEDAFPNNPTESADLDGDGVGDNADTDRDGDGVNNNIDAFPNDATESSDLDGDGLGDNSDPDRDGDGVNNDVDAFPNDATETSDLDGDGIGDNADNDRDGDGVNNDVDTFPNDATETSDLDGDGIGDNADTDRDGDGVNNDVDAFPNNATETTDLDGDGIGDNTDTDRDGDGVNNDVDAFPNDATETSDLDGDGIGDNVDTDRDGDGVNNDLDLFPNDASESTDLDGDGIGDNADTDRDGDGVNNEEDAFPNDATETSDLDGDGIGDNADTDRDGDGVNNDLDLFPNDASESTDLDGDGIGDKADTDRDGDGVSNDVDVFPNDATETSDLDGDGIGDNADTDRDGDGVNNDLDLFPNNASESTDLDGDGIGDNADLDRDGDGVNNDEDAFPDDPNGTSDIDGDGIEDSIDPDRDGDGVNNEEDAFPNNSTESSDLDGDGIGDNVDTDRDGDGVNNDIDAFPNDTTETADLDGDGIGDNADTDRDGDGVNNDSDAFPNNASESRDLDGDGIGDNADSDRDGDGVNNDVDAFPNDATETTDLDGDGIGDNADTDRDGDGVNNNEDAFPNNATETTDLDGDGIGDNSDTDRDGDGVNNDVDAFPNDATETTDLDGDGIGDNADTDRDGDGVNNDVDAFPNNATETTDLDGDGIGDNTDTDRDGDGVNNDIDAFPNDATESSDLDGDGIGDSTDTDRDGDGANNDSDAFPNDATESSDLDGDGIGDNADTDRDNDGVNNNLDAFPNDASETSDLDGDGIGDNADTDRDGDGVNNDLDAYPNDATESSDIDGDGIGDNTDTDRDGDGIDNDEDAFPNDATESSDTDGDGIGDNTDTDRDGDGIDNDEDAFPNDATESSDIDGDGIGDSSDTDRDGDGIDNPEDFYPNDPTRNELENISGLAINLIEESVILVWAPVTQESSLVHGYNLYRAEYNSSDFTKIASLNKNDVMYTDSSVENSKAYTYFIKPHAVDERESTKSNQVSLFVAYNNTVLEVNTTQTENGVRLNWTDGIYDEILIFRAQDEFALTLINKTHAAQYIDNNAILGNSYRYQIQSRKQFINPLNSNEFTIDGPLSNIASMSLSQPLVIKLDAKQYSTNSYQVLISNADTEIGLAGQHSNALGPVDMKFSTNGINVNGNAIPDILLTVEGDFSVALPLTTTNSWVLNSTSGVQSATVNINVQVDDQAPTLTINGATNIETEADTILVSGIAIDDQEIQYVQVHSNYFSQQAFTEIVSDAVENKGSFSIEIPVEVGINTLTISAVDVANNETSSVVTVSKFDYLTPIIEIVSHSDEQIVTKDQINMRGLIHSRHPVSQLSIQLGGIEGKLTAVDEDSYEFEFLDIALSQGINNFTLLANVAGQEATSLDYMLEYEPIVISVAPQLSIKSPLPGSYIGDQQFIVTGEIVSTSEISSFTINNENVYLVATNNDSYHFNYPAEFLADSVSLNVDVQASNGESASQDISYYRDSTAPTISLMNNLQQHPQINIITQNPYVLSGVVVDDNISSLTINDSVVELQPGANPNEYQFELSVNIQNQTETTFELNARDLSGNSTIQTFLVESTSSTNIDIISPSGLTDFVIDDKSFSLQVIARIDGMQETDKVRMTLDQSQPIFVEVTGGLVNTTAVIDTANIQNSSQQTLVLEVVNELNETVTSSKRNFKLINQANVTLELVNTVPNNGQTGAEPNEGIEVYFNKAIDPSLLSFEVRETVNGKTYVNNDAPGTNFLEAKGYQLTNVVRNNELVPGGVGLLPGNNVVTWYPQRDLAYNSNIFVTVNYDNKELTRFHYQVRELPTFLTGAVFDQLNQPVVGIKVELPELGRITTTDLEGMFNFGSGDQANDSLPAGAHQLVINDNFNNPLFGITERQVIIESGVHTKISQIIVPVLNKEVAFSPLNSGAINTLAGGEVTLDLTKGNVIFPDGQSSGLAHVSFDDIGKVDAAPTEQAYPFSLYSTQPAGITINGDINLSIKMLKLYNSYNYVPSSGSYVVLVGREGKSNTLTPIGVGQIDGYTINSIGKVHMNRLDFIGYVIVAEDKQSALQKYANGQSSIQALKGAL